MPTPKPLDFSDLKTVRRAKNKPSNSHRVYKSPSVRQYRANVGKQGKYNRFVCRTDDYDFKV